MCQAAGAREERIDQHAERHGPNPSDAVAQPAEQHAAGRRADQEAGRHHAKPESDPAFVGFAQQVPQGGPTDERKHAHLGPIEQPTQQRRRQRQPLATSRFLLAPSFINGSLMRLL